MDHLQSSVQNQKAYDTWAATYDLDRPPHTFLEQAEVLNQLSLNKNDQVLDAACGTGRYAKAALDVGATVSACDFSQQMIEKAKTIAPGADYEQVDLCQALPYASAQFSKVICSLAIRHIEKIEHCLQEFARVLRPDGMLVFSSIHPAMDWSTYERSSPPPIELNTEGKTFFYSIDEMMTAARAAGFSSVVKTELLATENVRAWLTEASALQQIGKPFVVVFTCRK